MLVSVVYSSGTGYTAKQAAAVAEGARSVPGTRCRLVNLSTEGVPWELLESSAGIVFGSPTSAGGISAEMRQLFAAATTAVWLGLRWRNKVAAAFTSSAGERGNELATLVSISVLAARHGMVWVGLDLPPNDTLPRIESDLRAAAYLGHRVAAIARRMHGARSQQPALLAGASDRVVARRARRRSAIDPTRGRK